MGILVYSPHQSSNHMRVSVQLTCGQKRINAVSCKGKHMIWEEMIYGFVMSWPNF